MAIEIQLLTVEQYLALETESEIRHEYIDGEIFPMTGGTLNHDEITVNLTLTLGAQLMDSNCRLHTSHMRVGVSPTRYVYPDLSAICGEAETDDGTTTLLNPMVVVEVISPSSIERDRIRKLELYGSVPSIQGYLILDQERVFAQWHTRTESGWHLQQFSDLADEIALEPLNCVLSLAQVYRNVNPDA
ncbi:MAG: Uma2 family endonuclease [Chloroflexota bacterium]|nr:Uma2 family endonuclease [Chloroflexota bacterium]